jgi:spermidine synthase
MKMDARLFDQDGVEVFKSAYFGKVLVADDVALYGEHDAAMRHEAMVHTAVCTHADPKRVLVIDGGDGALAHELLKHADLTIDIVERDRDMPDAAAAMGLYAEALQDDRVRLQVGDPIANLADTAAGTYDIVLINRLDGLYFDTPDFMQGVDRVLAEKGLVVTEAGSQLFDMPMHKRVLERLGIFKIVMPFRYTSMVRTGGEQWLAMGSKFYHPTADINLQRADLTDGYTWYNADLHIAQFALPTVTFELLRGYVKR